MKVGRSLKAEELDHLLSQQKDPDYGAYALAVINRDNEVKTSIRGFASTDDKIPFTSLTPFFIASLSKQFTAACIYVLCRKNRLSLKDTVRSVLSHLPPIYDSISINDLCRNRSGVFDFLDLHFIRGATLETGLPRELRDDWIQKLDSTLFQPGHQYRYSNTAFVLLAKVIVAVSGKTFAGALEKYVLKPSGLANTGFGPRGRFRPDNAAVGYFSRGNGEIEVGEWDIPAEGASDLWSTLDDLILWDRALYRNNLFGPEFREWMMAVSDFGSYDFPYGRGLFRGKVEGADWAGHIGFMPGYWSQLVHLPTEGTSIIALASTPGEFLTFNDLVPLLVEGGKFDQTPGSTSAFDIADFEGFYSDFDGGVTYEIRVGVAGAQIVVGGRSYPIKLEEEGRFRTDPITGVALVFELQALQSTTPPAIRVHYSSAFSRVLYRLEMQAGHQPPLEGFTGSFYSAWALASCAIEEADGRLVAKLNCKEVKAPTVLELQRIGPDNFIAHTYELDRVNFMFRRDKSGALSTLEIGTFRTPAVAYLRKV